MSKHTSSQSDNEVWRLPALINRNAPCDYKWKSYISELRTHGFSIEHILERGARGADTDSLRRVFIDLHGAPDPTILLLAVLERTDLPSGVYGTNLHGTGWKVVEQKQFDLDQSMTPRSLAWFIREQVTDLSAANQTEKYTPLSVAGFIEDNPGKKLEGEGLPEGETLVSVVSQFPPEFYRDVAAAWNQWGTMAWGDTPEERWEMLMVGIRSYLKEAEDPEVPEPVALEDDEEAPKLVLHAPVFAYSIGNGASGDVRVCRSDYPEVGPVITLEPAGIELRPHEAIRLAEAITSAAGAGR